MERLAEVRGLWLAVILCFISSSAFALDSVGPGTVHTDATLVNIGVRWMITDDDDLDAACTVRYRAQGAGTWYVGMDLVRSHPGLSGEGGDRPENRFAGTIFFLSPDTDYEIELTLADPDGGGTTRTVLASTAKEMNVSAAAKVYYVEPGSGGGSGTLSDPFKGLPEAVANAHPGAVFEIAAGYYDDFNLLASGEEENPIVLRGPVNPNIETDASAWAVVDGGDTDRGVVTIGEYSGPTGYVILENMVIQNGYWGVDAQNTHHILIRNNLIRDVGFGYYNRRANGLEGFQMLSDNTVIGRTSWPGTGIPSEQGISLRGSNNIVRYNLVRYFGDGVSVQPSTSAYGYANDIYANDIAYIVDDPIEIDYNSCNTRVWRNRVTSGRMGVSLAPIYGGPAYIFRNAFFNLESSAYKMNREPAGLVVLHNTSAKVGNGTSSPAGWQNTFLRNNVILGTRYVFEEYGLVAGSRDDWDFDALGTTYSLLAKWDDVRYADLDDLRQNSGVEAHAVGISLEDLVYAPLPADYTEGVAPDAADLRLKAGTDAIDAGQPIANINDPFVTDGAPDCGAFEYGEPLPEYGPRDAASLPDEDPPDPGDDSGSSGGSGSDDTGASDGSGGGGGGCFILSLICQ